MLESEKIALSGSLEEAKAARDEAMVMVDSLRSECERQIRMAKEEADEKVARAVSERDETMKSLEKGKTDLKAAKESIRKEAYELAREDAIREILKYGLSFKRSAIFMIKQKYPELDLSNIDLSFMHGYNVSDPVNKFELIENLNVGGSEIVVD